MKTRAIQKPISFLMILFLALLLTSCDKNENNEQSRIDLLTSKSWVVKSKIILPAVNMNGIVITDIMMLDSEEVKNYSYKYNQDGTLNIYSKTNQQVFSTNWTFNADETEIYHNPGIIYNYPIVGDISLTNAKLVSISGSKMEASIPSSYEGTNYEITITFIPK